MWGNGARKCRTSRILKRAGGFELSMQEGVVRSVLRSCRHQSMGLGARQVIAEALWNFLVFVFLDY
jgi:hypothetical protein